MIRKMTSLVKFLCAQYRNRLVVFIAVIVIPLIFFFYRYSFLSYFEGDEWIFFSFFKDSVNSPYWPVAGFTDTFRRYGELNVHIAPISNMIYVIQYKLFKLNFIPYLISSLLLHSLTSIVYGLFVHKLTGNKLFAVGASLLFGLLSTHYQAITWVVASVYTQLSVLFGVIAFTYAYNYAKELSKKDALLCTIFLFFSVFSKETGYAFLIGTPIFVGYISYRKGGFEYLKQAALTAYRMFLLVFGISILVRIPQIISLFLAETEGASIQLMLFRLVTYTSKVISQAIIPNHYLIDFSKWITEMQFPFFNQEASVEGTTYLNFVQTAVPEFLSHIATAIIISIIFLAARSNRKTKTLRNISLLMIIIATVPILFISLKFPWWGYTSIIDSRHLYHVSIWVVMLINIVLLSFSEKIEKVFSLKWQGIYILLLVIILIFQLFSLRRYILSQQEASHFRDRKMIVNTLVRDVEPKEKMIVYTGSNMSFYGFGLYMLPFQTSFAHMLPVIFSETYHTNGIPYPKSFYSKDYMPVGGLVTQGFYQDGKYLLGYYLEKEPLIRTIEENNLNVDVIYAFEYDGYDHKFTNITGSLRGEIESILNSRKVFSDWRRYAGPDEYFTFLADSEWNVDKKNSTYIIQSSEHPILTIDVIQNVDNIQFSAFVDSQLINGQPVNGKYTTETLQLDLDKNRILLRPEASKNTVYLVAGNNLMFYRLTIQDEEDSALLMRTLEFVDEQNEKIGGV